MRSDAENGCWCDMNCKWRQDCCGDYQALCVSSPSAPSSPSSPSSPSFPSLSSLSQTFSAAASAASLPSASAVHTHNTVTSPHSSHLPTTHLGSSSSSCLGACGASVVSADGHECFCDASCSDQHDCCPDFFSICSSSSVSGTADQTAAAGAGASEKGEQGTEEHNSSYEYEYTYDYLVPPTPPSSFSNFFPVSVDNTPSSPSPSSLSSLSSSTSSSSTGKAKGKDTDQQANEPVGPSGPSCLGNCGALAVLGSQVCYCDSNCVWHSDCCSDISSVCAFSG